MTRKEEIEQAASERATKLILGGCAKEESRLDIIEDSCWGAYWADEHPKNPWISVEDRLPELYQDVIVINNGKPIMSRRYKCQVRSKLTNNEWVDSWRWSRNLVNVTHWMLIPDAPACEMLINGLKKMQKTLNNQKSN